METKKEIDENEIEKKKFEQLIMKIHVGKYFLASQVNKIIFLKKGILIVYNKEMLFYDYIKLSKHILMPITKEFGNYNSIQLGELKNNKFFMCTQNETFIYQLNDDFTIKLLNRLNINLFNLVEIEDNIYLNKKRNYMFIWKELKSIYKKNQLLFYVLNAIFVLFFALGLFLLNFNKITVFTVIILEFTTFVFIYRKYVYLLNPYKRIKTNVQTPVRKCGKYLYFESSPKTGALIDYKTFEIRTIKFGNDNSPTSLWSSKVINDNTILFVNISDKRCKIYDVKKDKIINEYTSDFYFASHKSSKIRDNLYYSFDKNFLYKWKYDFELKKVIVLNKKNAKYLGKFEECEIINNKLYILRGDITNVNAFEITVSVEIYQ